MRLYLVRHGEARSKEEDPERHLTERGVEDVRRVADFLAAVGVKVSKIYHSGKTRAKETAEIISSKISPEEVVPESGLNPLDDPTTWASRLNSSDEDLMLVGHLPHLSRLAGLLLGCEGDVLRLEAAGVACLERGEGGWKLLWMIAPEILKGGIYPSTT